MDGTKIVVAEVKDNKLVIQLPIEVKPSKSGKFMLVAGTSGFAPSLATYEGKPLSISVNAGFKP